MLFTNNNPQGYKEDIISFIVFDFGESGTIIAWLENMTYMCPILRNHIKTQSLKIWEIQLQHIYYYTYNSVGLHVQLMKKIRLYL